MSNGSRVSRGGPPCRALQLGCSQMNTGAPLQFSLEDTAPPASRACSAVASGDLMRYGFRSHRHTVPSSGSTTVSMW